MSRAAESDSELAPSRSSVTGRAYRFAAVYLAIVGISVLHYVAPVQADHLHEIYRRLYYLPIIFAAFLGGFRGGVVAGILVCVVYAPHAFGHISHDPATDMQKVLEMLLYLAVGITTGWLVSRLERTRRDLQGSIQRLHATEEQLVRAAKLAAVGRLSAGLAHEIRNPLASIKGSAELLADDFPPEHPKRRLLEVLVDESSRLNNVLSRFLFFARPRPPEEQELDVKGEIGIVIALLQGHGEGQSVRFSVDAATSHPIRMRADREQLRQVLLNILLNACQASDVNGEVWVHCEATGDVCRIIVRDSGSGFTDDAIQNAFTPFFTTKAQGTGLGLAVSFKIVESHGGRIRIGNHDEGGGLVEVEIPLRR